MAVNDALLERNPAALLHAPRGKKREQPVLNLQQAIIILSALGVRERLIVKLAGICGMRARARPVPGRWPQRAAQVGVSGSGASLVVCSPRRR